MPEIAIDSIFALILVVSLALGAWRGLFYEVLSLLSWIAAFMLSQLLATDLAQILPMGGAGEPIRFAGLQSTDRALGALFGVLRGVILLLVLTAAVSMSQFKNSAWWKESTGVGIALAALQNLKPLLPEDVGKYLP
jgi:membrane protein required for colicin V production